MTLALWLQWVLLAGNMALLVAVVVICRLRPRLRPGAFAVGVLAGAHAVYYALFLIWPDALDATETMLLSIALRYMVMFLAAFVLVLMVSRWNR